MIESCLQEHEDGVVVSLQVQPRASRNQVVGIHNDNLKIKLTSPPVDGAANKSCCAYLAKLFGVAKSDIMILSGETARQKRILVRHISFADAHLTIAAALK